MVSTSATSFDCQYCGYPRGLHTPDCPNAIHVVALETESRAAELIQSDPASERRGLPVWLNVAGLLVVVGAVGWFAYRKLSEFDRAEITNLESADAGNYPTRQALRPFLKPQYVDPATAEAILDQVLEAEWLDP